MALLANVGGWEGMRGVRSRLPSGCGSPGLSGGASLGVRGLCGVFGHAFVQVRGVKPRLHVHDWCGARVAVTSRGGVEAGHQFAVRGAGRGEVLVSFLELQAQVDGLLLELGDALLEFV